MRLNDDDIQTTGPGGLGEGPADGGANPAEQDGGADGGAVSADDLTHEGPADGGANPVEHDGGADGGASVDRPM